MPWSPVREYTRAYDKSDDVPFPVRGVPGGWRDPWDGTDPTEEARPSEWARFRPDPQSTWTKPREPKPLRVIRLGGNRFAPNAISVTIQPSRVRRQHGEVAFVRDGAWRCERWSGWYTGPLLRIRGITPLAAVRRWSSGLIA
jgi:hypothetical protein